MVPPKVASALTAMKAIGISPHTVKPVLKNLLKLYDDNWELIEEENYRVLADAIFDFEESKDEEGRKKKLENLDHRVEDKKKSWINDEPEPPRTRLRSRQEEDQPSPPLLNSSIEFAETPLKRPKLSEAVSPQTCIRQERVEPSSPQTFPRENRIQPPSPQIVLKMKRPVPERVATMSCLKEPKIEPGIALLPKENVPNHQNSYKALIKPKSEPETVDFAPFEVPIAVIHPPKQGPSRYGAHQDRVSKEDSSFGNDSTGQTDALEALASQYEDVGDEEDDLADTAFENGTSLQLVSVPEATPANLEIASSTLGEVKLSLICDSVLDRSNFHVPSLDAVLKLLEDKCLKSYKIVEPNFSVMKLMKDLCQCFLDLGTDNTDDKQETLVNITPTLEFLKKCNVHNALGANGNCLQGNFNMVANSANGLNNFHCPTDLFHNTESNQTVSGNSYNERDKKKKEPESSEPPKINSDNLVVFHACQVSLDDAKPLHDVNDISKSEEKVRISLVNEVSSEPYPPSFYYIPQNLVYQNAYINFSLARIGDEDCCSDCFGDCLSASIPCPCARETGGEYAYTLDGLIKSEFLDECISMSRDPQNHRLFYCNDCPLERSKSEDMPDLCKGHLVRKFIKECWSKCGCSKQCGNRVVQRGITCNLQVFLTSEGKGWGLRTLEELPKGTFVCEYVGEILTNKELYNRNVQNAANERHTYPVLLDADWGSGILKDEEALCLDATFYGNVARFINHRCFDANLIEVPVEVESPDHRYYHLAFFTTRKVEALDELTWDYGIDFNDLDHPVKAFHCRCGSEFCRGVKRSKRIKPSALILR
eukprot:TRINITY_DN10583_c0_g1_i1.p1 TRINITY_DN10583_c0_g1~~TRINITY_DN10583_c0_g1_i1.p1  ORF type:complete len:822 (-),score=156.55 TRINITY_DN10583_c0_g1_i1:322-2787(-)